MECWNAEEWNGSIWLLFDVILYQGGHSGHWMDTHNTTIQQQVGGLARVGRS